VDAVLLPTVDDHSRWQCPDNDQDVGKQ